MRTLISKVIGYTVESQSINALHKKFFVGLQTGEGMGLYLEGGGAHKQNKKSFRTTRQTVSEKRTKASIPLHLELFTTLLSHYCITLLLYYPVSLELSIENFDLCKQTLRECTYTLDGLKSVREGSLFSE